MELFLIAIAWLFGILIGLYFRIGIVLFVVLWGILYKKRINKYMIIVLICFLISFLQITHLEHKFNEKYKNISQQIKVVGTIISNPIKKQYQTKYIINIEQIDSNKSYKNTNLILYIKNQKGTKEYKYGDKISCLAEFELPKEQRNTGGFNYKEYLKTKNIYGIITSNPKDVNLIKENNLNIISIAANRLAIKIKENAEKILKEEANTLIAILVGDKANLEEEIQEDFRKSNLSHIIAVSGAHVSYIIMGIGFIVSKSKISKNKGKIITIILLLFFIILTRKNTISYKSLHNVHLYDYR